MTLTMADVCGCICAACSIFTVLFQIWEHPDRKANEHKKK